MNKSNTNNGVSSAASSKTRDDVAALAGVSAATVSRAYNLPEKVSAEKLERIRAAAEKLGYVPDKRAGALRRGSSGSILLLMPRNCPDEYPDSRFYRWFIGDIIISLQDIAAQSSFSLQTDTVHENCGLAEVLRKNRCDAVLAGNGTLRYIKADELMRCGLPYAVCGQGDDYPPGLNLCYIDEKRGGALAAASLQRAGYKRLAHITGALKECNVCAYRWQGFKSAVSGYEPLLINGDLGIKGGYESGRKILSAIKNRRVDGIFVVNDLTCVGVVQALLEAGVKIPEQTGLTGYDNLPFIQTMPIIPATMDIGMSKMYSAAFRHILDMLKGAKKHVREAIIPEFTPGFSLKKEVN